MKLFKLLGSNMNFPTCSLADGWTNRVHQCAIGRLLAARCERQLVILGEVGEPCTILLQLAEV